MAEKDLLSMMQFLVAKNQMVRPKREEEQDLAAMHHSDRLGNFLDQRQVLATCALLSMDLQGLLSSQS